MADKANAPDVGVAVFLGKSQALAEIGAHDVAIEHFNFATAAFQHGNEVLGDCGLAGAGKPGKP